MARVIEYEKGVLPIFIHEVYYLALQGSIRLVIGDFVSRDIEAVEVHKDMPKHINLCSYTQIVCFPLCQQNLDIRISRSVAILPNALHCRLETLRQLK